MEQVLDAAASLDPGVLRALDAIHLASAAALGTDLEAVVTYDRRLAEAAGLMRMDVAAPS